MFRRLVHSFDVWKFNETSTDFCFCHITFVLSSHDKHVTQLNIYKNTPTYKKRQQQKREKNLLEKLFFFLQLISFSRVSRVSPPLPQPKFSVKFCVECGERMKTKKEFTLSTSSSSSAFFRVKRARYLSFSENGRTKHTASNIKINMQQQHCCLVV